MAKVIVRQQGLDDFSMPLPDYAVGRQYVNYTVRREPVFITDVYDPSQVQRDVVELEFVGYEEFGKETLAVYKVIGAI